MVENPRGAGAGISLASRLSDRVNNVNNKSVAIISLDMSKVLP